MIIKVFLEEKKTKQNKAKPKHTSIEQVVLGLKTLLALGKLGEGRSIFYSPQMHRFLPAFFKPDAVWIELHDKFGF